MDTLQNYHWAVGLQPVLLSFRAVKQDRFRPSILMTLLQLPALWDRDPLLHSAAYLWL